MKIERIYLLIWIKTMCVGVCRGGVGVQGIQPRVSHMLGKCSTSELYAQLSSHFLF